MKQQSIFLKAAGFVLSPFAKQVQYLMIKIMKRFRKPDDKRPIIAASGYLLDHIIIPSVFRFFQDEEFRERAAFRKLTVAEHDRIFNELQVAGICLTLFYLSAMKSRVRLADYHYWQAIEEHLPKQFQRILMGYGVDGGNAKLMRELIALRHEEFERLSQKIWDTSDTYSVEFQSLPSEMKSFGAGVQATAIGMADHILRGKLKSGDPLTQLCISWLLTLQRSVGRFVRNL